MSGTVQTTALTAMLQAEPENLQTAIDTATLLGTLAVLIGAYVAARAAAFLLSAAAERSPSRRITIKMFVPVVKLLVYGIALYIVVVPLFELTSAQLLALSGLIGAALGFGLQDLVSALFGGFVLVTEKPYQVGDKVTIDDHYGEVTDIGLRATTLVTPGDTTVVVPNDHIFTGTVANANDGSPKMLVTVDLAVSPDADTTRALSILEDALVTSPYVYVDDDHPVSVRLSDQVSYRQVRGRAYVSDHRNERAFASDVTERALAAFDEEGIETPESPQLHHLDD